MPTRCPAFPAVRVRGSSLEYAADGSRFFASGWVYSGVGSGAAALSRFDAASFEGMLQQAGAVGMTTVRWNTFVKGLDLTFGDDGLVAGVKRLDSLVTALDLARKHGILLQIVLATGHFLRCGWGGCDNVLGGVTNAERVEHKCDNAGWDSRFGRPVHHALSCTLHT